MQAKGVGTTGGGDTTGGGAIYLPPVGPYTFPYRRVLGFWQLVYLRNIQFVMFIVLTQLMRGRDRIWNDRGRAHDRRRRSQMQKGRRFARILPVASGHVNPIPYTLYHKP